MTSDLVIRSRRVVTPQGMAPAAVHIADGVIADITDITHVGGATRIDEVDDAVVMPGLVDTHVHLNAPGRAEWEGFASGTRAAAAGGVTTILEMPLNSIPATTSVAALDAKREAAAGTCWVDVGFWGGVVPGNTRAVRALYEAGVFGFKCFLVDSGVPEFPAVGESDLREALPELHALDAVLLAHAELPAPIEEAQRALTAARADASDYSTYLRSRPREAENEAIALLMRLCREFDAVVHIVHLSSADALSSLHDAQADGLPVSVETCPHYLFFEAGDVPAGATEFKCAPPIRERDNRERLWSGLREGVIQVVVSDHSPCPPEMKRRDTGDFLRAWGGIASLQLGLSAVWTAAQPRGHTLLDVARWMSEAPARLAGLEGCKGRLAPGCDADIVVFRPERSFNVVPEALQHRHHLTPYAARRLTGVVQATYLRGEKIYEDGRWPCESRGPRGRLLRPVR